MKSYPTTISKLLSHRHARQRPPRRESSSIAVHNRSSLFDVTQDEPKGRRDSPASVAKRSMSQECSGKLESTSLSSSERREADSRLSQQHLYKYPTKSRRHSRHRQNGDPRRVPIQMAPRHQSSRDWRRPSRKNNDVIRSDGGGGSQIMKIPNHTMPYDMRPGVESYSGLYEYCRVTEEQQRTYRKMSNGSTEETAMPLRHHGGRESDVVHQRSDISRQKSSLSYSQYQHPSIICRANMINLSAVQSSHSDDVDASCFEGPGLFCEGWNLDDGKWTDPDGFISLSQKQRIKFHSWRRITEIDAASDRPSCIFADRPKSRYCHLNINRMK